MEMINRNCFVVRPKKPFFDWLNGLFHDEEPIEEKGENNVYLIREMDSNEEIARWIDLNYKAIFENELNDWFTDESAWPDKRTLPLFKTWFDIEINSMVIDLEKSKITKD